jgi:hypothetical protein
VALNRPLGPEANCALIYFTATGSDGDEFNWRIYAYKENGPAKYVANGTATLGTATVNATDKYIDTIVISNQGWFKIPAAIDSGNNRVAYLAYDLCGHQYLWVELTNVGGGGEPSSVNAYITYF